MTLFDRDYWQEIFHTLGRNKMRSVLTVFGVFWGVFMLIVMSGAGGALEKGMLQSVENTATNSAFFWAQGTSEPYKGHQTGRSWTIKVSDLEVLKERIDGLSAVSPQLFGQQSDGNVSFGEHSGTFSTQGLYPDHQQIDRKKITQGRFINQVDLLDKRKVCVIGNQVYETLFPDKGNPLGENIKVNGIYYTIVGVMTAYSENGPQMGGRTDELIILPYSTMQQAQNTGDDVYFLSVAADDDIDIDQVEEQVKTVLKDLHQIAPNDQSAVGSFNMGSMFKQFSYLFLGINILVWIVGGGTLLAGVVGVSNIMLISIKERTKEIGIRRALGAQPSVIVKQIMSESLLLTLIAGLFGITLAVLVLNVAENILQAQADNTFFSDPQISFTLAMVALVVLVLTGLLAGLMPVFKALNIKAIDAIREE